MGLAALELLVPFVARNLPYLSPHRPGQAGSTEAEEMEMHFCLEPQRDLAGQPTSRLVCLPP